jgi:hypothetical protein
VATTGADRLFLNNLNDIRLIDAVKAIEPKLKRMRSRGCCNPVNFSLSDFPIRTTILDRLPHTVLAEFGTRAKQLFKLTFLKILFAILRKLFAALRLFRGKMGELSHIMRMEGQEQIRELPFIMGMSFHARLPCGTKSVAWQVKAKTSAPQLLHAPPARP